MNVSPQVVSTVREAFVSALGTGLTISAAVTLSGAALAWALIQRAAEPQPRGELTPATGEGAPAISEDAAGLEVGVA